MKIEKNIDGTPRFFLTFIVFLLLLSCDNGSYKKNTIHFLAQHEDKLKAIVEYCNTHNIKSNDHDATLDSILKEIDLRASYTEKDIVFIGIARPFISGYGVAYKENVDQYIPSAYHSMPIEEWIMLKKNWYYFKFAD